MPNISGYGRRVLIEMKFSHSRIIGNLAVCHLSYVRTNCSEIFGEPSMVLEADLLVPKEQDEIFCERASQLGKFQIRQRARQIDIADFRADMRATGRHRNCAISLVGANVAGSLLFDCSASVVQSISPDVRKHLRMLAKLVLPRKHECAVELDANRINRDQLSHHSR